MSQMNEKLRILLKNQGWTQPKLAETLHFAPSTVHYWLNGTHCPSVETLKKLCEILYIPIQDLLNDELDIPEYYEIDQYLPYPICCYPEDRQDSIHTIIDAGLAYEGILHRFINCAGAECSAIYRAGKEVWWHYRENEARMIRDWNEVHAND